MIWRVILNGAGNDIGPRLEGRIKQKGLSEHIKVEEMRDMEGNIIPNGYKISVGDEYEPELARILSEEIVTKNPNRGRFQSIDVKINKQRSSIEYS